MKTLGLSIAILSIPLALPAVSQACQFDTDCEVGSKCYKPNRGLNGWCVGGLNPGNGNDRKSWRDPMDITGKRENTCQFDTDCGVGGQCITGSGIDGTCL